MRDVDKILGFERERAYPAMWNYASNCWTCSYCHCGAVEDWTHHGAELRCTGCHRPLTIHQLHEEDPPDGYPERGFGIPG